MVVTCRFEPLSYLLMSGLPKLAYMAWEETNYGRNHFGQDYAPDWEAYQRMEDRHYLRLVAMRDDGDLIGYASVAIDSETHRSGLVTSTYRDIYVVPSKRGYAARLVKYVDKHMEDLGVKRALIGEQVGGNCAPEAFYLAMGYTLQEKIYGKVIGSC